MAKKILVVEDEPEVVDLERAILRGAGYTVDVAQRGSEALEQLSTTAYEAVVLDLIMPGMDGYEIARRMRQLEMNRNTPVVMVTGSGEPDAMRRGFDVGAVVFLRKPFTAGALRSAVRSVVR